uniref:Uncharacterized protein n=1 Tax=Caenorhabditis tropicalis TaxID=1561998 RepID=A0A1I7UN43_9PELO
MLQRKNEEYENVLSRKMSCLNVSNNVENGNREEKTQASFARRTTVMQHSHNGVPSEESESSLFNRG